jgi:biopolymer transport protein ExbD
LRFKRYTDLKHSPKPIDITPFIGVVFLLLIFFMLTSSFIIYPGLKVGFPRTATSSAAKYGNPEITISADNAIYTNGNPLSLDGLKVLFGQVGQARGSVLIKADKRASLGRISEICDIGRSSGIAQINLATSQE